MPNIVHPVTNVSLDIPGVVRAIPTPPTAADTSASQFSDSPLPVRTPTIGSTKLAGLRQVERSGARALTRSIAKASWVQIAFSTQSVPSLSKTAIAPRRHELGATRRRHRGNELDDRFLRCSTLQEGSGSAAAERDGKGSRLQRVVPAFPVCTFQRYGPPSSFIPPRSCRAQLFGKTFAATASE